MTIQYRQELPILESKRKTIIEYYKDKKCDEDLKQALDYLTTHQFVAFPYPFIEDFNYKNVKVKKDFSCGLHYVIHNGKKLYFKRSLTVKSIQKVYTELLIEQHLESPHRYLTDEFTPENKDIFVDVGSAEGILSLDLVDKVSKIYCFEYDDQWIEAMEHTFAPWKDKVVIIRKYVSEKDDSFNISLDTFFKYDKYLPTFIKMDVEGAELLCLKGAENIIRKSDNLKILVTTYHRANDHFVLKEYLEQRSFQCEFSQGFMIFSSDRNFCPPYLRRDLIRAYKSKV